MIGRNELCPCGSGKKYKKCCGANEAVSINQVLESEIDDLQKRMVYYALDHFEEDIQEGFEDYQEFFPIEDEEELQFYEFVYSIWFCLFYTFEDGETILEKFIKTEAGKIKRQKTKQILQSWIHPRTIVGEITDIEQNKLIVTDGFTSEVMETIVINTKRSFEKGSFFIGILLPYEQKYVFFPAPFDLEGLPAAQAYDFIKQGSLKAGYQTPQEFLTDFFMEIMKDLTQVGGQVDIESMEWDSPVYKEVAAIYQKTLESLGEHPPTVDIGIILWYQYCKKKQKRIKNPNLYAAALHYLVSMFDHMEAPLTQKETADLYGVPVGSVSTAYREMDAELEEEITRIIELSYEDEDTTDPVPSFAAHSVHQTGPMPAERALQEAMADLQGKDFASIEEINEYMNKKLNSPAPRKATKTNQERAQQLVYDAMEANGQRRYKLANEALALDSTCADAYVILAEDADNLEDAMLLYKKGMEAGEKQLGKAFIKNNKGHFWVMLETRPYMRAKAGYADTVYQLGHTRVAIIHYEEMLILNPNDNQGVRYLLFPAYMDEGLLEKAEKLLQQYKEEAAHGVYNELLLELAKNGFSAKAGRMLKTAKKANSNVIAYLTGKKRLPKVLPEYYQWGNDNEAIIYADTHRHLWEKIEGIKDWLNKH